MTAHYIASVDAGNGGTNGVLAKPNGKYKSVYFPSVRAMVTGDSLGLGREWEVQVDYVDWNGHRYAVGDDVRYAHHYNVEHHMGANRYGNEFHQFLVAKALADLGVKDGTVDLTVFTPPGLFLETKEYVRNNFLEQGGVVSIKLKDEKKSRTWRYVNVTVWPENLGAAACYVLDEKGRPSPVAKALEGTVIFLDIGAFTLDAVQLEDGNFNAESLQHATWENGGVDAHIRQPIVRTLKKRSSDFANITVDDVDRVIRTGLKTGDYMLRVGAVEVDLKTVIAKHAERHAEWIANNIIDGVFGGLNGIKAMGLVGGGTILVEGFLRQWYGDKVLDQQKHPTARNIHPVDMNAVGGLRLALMRQK